MHQYVHDVFVYLEGHASLRLVGQQDVLDPQERHQDERGPHGFHVETGLRLVGHLQLGDEYSHNVQQEEQIDLVVGATESSSVNQQRIEGINLLGKDFLLRTTPRPFWAKNTAKSLFKTRTLSTALVLRDQLSLKNPHRC